MNESSAKSTTTATDLLTAPQTLELIESLRISVREISDRASAQERDLTSRIAKLRAQFDQAIGDERTGFATKIKAVEAGASGRREMAKSSYDARKARISKAFYSTRSKRLTQIEKEESQRTIEIQHALLDVERRRDAALKEAGNKLGEFNTRLVGENDALQKTETAARFALGAYRSLARLLVVPPEIKPDLSGDENKLIERFRERLKLADEGVARCRSLVLPVFFRVLPVWVCVPIVLGLSFAVVPGLRRFDFASVPSGAWAVVGGSVAGLLLLYFIGRALAAPAARTVATTIEEARKLYDAAVAKSQSAHSLEAERAGKEFATTTQALNADWKEIQVQARTLRSGWDERLNNQFQRATKRHEDRNERVEFSINSEQHSQTQRITTESAARLKGLQTAYDENSRKLSDSLAAARQSVETDWEGKVVPALNRLRAAEAAAEKQFAPWQPERWEKFSAPDQFLHAARFGQLQVDWEKLCGMVLPENAATPFHPAEQRVAVSNGGEHSFTVSGSRLPPFGTSGTLTASFSVPLILSVPNAASILFETKSSSHEQIIGALNNIILRLLTASPPGQVAFTIFDPVGLGQNFAGIMHLADFEERVINSRIWTQQAQFEQRLADLNEHIEKVTQMYLRNEYETLAEYNAQAGRLAEKYQFLVIADFPVNFSDVAVKRLQNIIASGPRCGVHTLIHWDQRKPAPLELVPDELRKNALVLVPRGDGFAAANTNWEGVKLLLDAPPNAELTTELLQKIGKASVDSYRVEMPFAEVAPAENEMWSLDTTRELRIPVGRTGATKLQYLALGQGTRQHGLVAGKTGSGKSTLFHVIITNLALWCSPEQVEFYLVDFKKGVEFKCYATHKLPHARVIAIESDREFGLSVLQRVDDELKRRGDLFRKLGAQDIAGYKRAGGTEPMPRVLLLIDEFQELFVEDDRVSQGAALLLDRIVRQGRAFGIHVLLGSQTLGGAYTLARATIGQMVVRVALQCNEADAYLIMTEDNPAPRLLSRPGEAIYNDDGGSIQGNSPFQVVWLPDQVRDEWLDKASALGAKRVSAREPIIFEGNAPASVRDNPALRSLLNASSITPTSSPRIWLGAPNSIKGPTEAVFQRQSGNHLLIVGQREEAALAMLALAPIALAAQHARDTARILVFDCSAPDSDAARMFARVAQIVPGVKLVGANETQEVIAGLAAELDRRNEQPGANAPATFLLVHGLQQNKKLRFDEEASFSLDAGAVGGNPGLLFNNLICEGASQGIHVVAACDTYNNLMRMLSRKAVSEFEMRVVFQMAANDSASLIESSTANNLGLHRAILHNGQQGWMETFRPYALPDEEWLKEAGTRMATLAV